MKLITIMILAIATIFLVQGADAKRHHHKTQVDANGNTSSGCQVRSQKTKATATVGCQHAASFQSYINSLESAGATILFMGGNRHGHCSDRHMHSCGRALDVCQLSRGKVDSRCHLPSRSAIASIAARHGLFEGGQWCNHDYGHAQVGVSAAACGERTLMARTHIRHHRQTRIAASHPATFQYASWPPSQ